MTTETTKAGKKCHACWNGEVYLTESPQPCTKCHGLRWLPQPGDALTPIEAEALIVAGREDVEENQVCFSHTPVWFKTLIPPSQKMKGAAFQFRLAPAQEQPADKLKLDLITQEADAARKRVSGYSQEQREELHAEAIKLIRGEQPAEKQESVEEALQRITNPFYYDQAQINWLRTGFLLATKWLLSLTPVQLEALRKL